MKQFITLLKKEFMGYFLSYAAYFIVALYLFLSMVANFYFGAYFITNNTDLYSFFYFQPHILLFVIPALAMRSWSDEKKSGTYEVVLSYPMSYCSLVMAKFWACLKISALMILLTAPLWIYSALSSNIDNLSVISAYIGCIFAAAMFCAVCCLISSTNSSPIVSYLLSVFVLWMLVNVDYNFIIKPLFYASSVIFVNIQGAFNFENHYNAFVSAQIGFDNVIYFISFITVALVLNKIVIEDRKDKSWLGISLIGILLVIALMLINILSSMLFSTNKIDMTSDKRYTLSEATKEIIANNSDVIDIKVYLSKDIRKISPIMADYSKFVLNYLEKYKKESNGKINIDVRTTERYSVTEREAKENGIMSILGNSDSDLIYFGAVISTSSGKSQTINILHPKRKQYLEKDISRAIYKLSQEKIKRVGWVNTLGFDYTDDVISSVLQENYNVVRINQHEIEIPNTIDTLVVVNIQHASRFLSYGIDQFLMRGKNVIAFVDNVNSQVKNKENSIYTPNILDSWGVIYDDEEVVGDNLLALKKVVEDDGVKRIASDILAISVTKEYINQENPITKGLTNISFVSPALIGFEENDKSFMTPLVTTSKENGIVKTDVARTADDKYINDNFKFEDAENILAMLIEGKSTSIFNNNILANTKYESDMAPFLIMSINPAKLVVVSDVNILDGDSWSYYGDRINPYTLIVPNNNVDFITRSLDYLTGNNLLLGINNKSIIYNQKSLFEKYRDEAVGRRFDDISKIEVEIVRKQEAVRSLSKDIDSQFSMAKVKDLEILNKELLELREKSKYLIYIVSKETTSSMNAIIILFALAVPVVSVLIMFAVVSILRRRKIKKVLEMLNEG
ncbi:MAG: Gldg family protein [Lactobacillaceae bacterium]|jgi:ABC-2 type transport system permease protein|nr:Gldg family protein [Lactobacillaceae bacterium]